MKKLLILIGAVTLVQGFTVGISLAMLMVIISRVLFASRLSGMKTKLGTIVTLELFSIGFAIIMPIIFGGSLGLFRAVVFILCSLLYLIVVIYDESVYVYDEEEI